MVQPFYSSLVLLYSEHTSLFRTPMSVILLGDMISFLQRAAESDRSVCTEKMKEEMDEKLIKMTHRLCTDER